MIGSYIDLTISLVDVVVPLVKVGTLCASTFGLTYMIKDAINPSNKLCRSNELNSMRGDGIQIAKNVRLDRYTSNQHILCVAPSGWGKSKHIAMNNLDNLNNCDCNIEITGPCKERQHKVKVNKKAYIFNQMDIQNT